MLVLENNETHLHTVKKSKFIGKLFPAFSKEECDSIIENIKLLYKDAHHVCYAYVLTSPPSEKCYDDGEPKGTAGMPILNVLKKQKLENVLMVVVRYFGGIKLGAGGLIKAYMDTCIGAIKHAQFKEYKEHYIYSVRLRLSDMQTFENYIFASGLRKLESDFTSIAGEVVYKIASAEQLNKSALLYIESLKGNIQLLKTKFISMEEDKL